MNELDGQMTSESDQKLKHTQKFNYKSIYGIHSTFQLELYVMYVHTSYLKLLIFGTWENYI